MADVKAHLSRCVTRTFALAGLLGTPLTAEARFAVEDADVIGDERRLGSEFFNDRFSYRYPIALERMWTIADHGVRINAGSLDMDRFDYAEDVKLQAGRHEDASLSYMQRRREDFAEGRTEREVSASYRFLPHLRGALMADGGSNKAYGDVGGALAFELDLERRFELFYWSVDHFYATKKQERSDSRPRAAKTAGFDTEWHEGSLHLKARYEHDFPMLWQRSSSGYQYDYMRRTLSYLMETQQSDPSWRLLLQGEHERKYEAKAGETSFRRRFDQIELATIRSQDQSDLALGLIGLHRDADYDQLDPLFDETPSAHRRELASYLTYEQALVTPHHFAQVGLHADKVIVGELGHDDATEVKVQLAWDYRYSDKAALVLNTTWDIDQLARDFPYREEAFRPWGGGNIQIVATF